MNGKKIALGISAVVSTVAIAYASYTAYTITDFFGRNPESDQIITVEAGDSASAILSKIEAQTDINPPLLSSLASHIVVDTSSFQTGRYMFNSDETVKDFLDEVVRGEQYRETFQFTIPEGFKARNIDRRLSDMGFTESGAIIAEAQNVDKYVSSYSFLSEFGELSTLEGFLFPDTYLVYDSISAEIVVNEMLKNFKTKAYPLLSRTASNPEINTKYNLLTLASMVQSEAGAVSDMPKIASVFTNRISIDMKLQSDATWFYRYPDPDRFAMTLEEVRTPDPYNTYYNEGLPPTPISNPGTDAIQAASNPADTDFFYFFAEPPNPESIFSETLEEHNRKLGRN
jgi:UPF0755 protein